MKLRWDCINLVRDAEGGEAHTTVMYRSVAYLSPNTSAWQGLENNKWNPNSFRSEPPL